MRIGIDAKWFYEGPPSGRNVVRNHVEQIIKHNTQHELFIFLDKRMQEYTFPFPSPLVKLVYVWGNNNFLSNLFVIPIVAWGHKLDCMVFQNFVPIFSNLQSIALIYDVIFLSHPQYFTRKEQMYLYPIKWLSRFASKICTISHSEKNRIMSYCNTPDNKIDVIHIGVSPEFKTQDQYSQDQLLTVRQRYGLPETFILYVGRLNERKNILNLLKSIPLLDNRNIPLVLVGSYDWKMFNIDSAIRDFGITDRVHLTGFVSDEDLPLVYSLATIFWFVSFEEGFGLPPLEAMASGVPVVISDRSSLPEVCGEAGNYANPDSPQSIAEAIDRLLGDKDLYNSKIEQGLRRAEQFTWEQSANKLMQCILNSVGA